VSPLAAAQRLGRYELVRRLGFGASGEVWEATLHGPEGFRRPVALKVLRGVPDEARRAGLLREARLGALLQHPNVVAVHDAGEADGRGFVAMELVVGVSLAAAAEPGPLSPRAVLDVGLQTCAALAHLAASGGLVHRDVKPSNLMLDRFGTVKLTDLGIARWASEEGVAAGTPGYASPEQLAGRPTDARSDLFSLGMTLAALATAAAPLGLGKAAITRTTRIDEHVDGALEPVERAVPGLGAVLRRCLAADPDARFADARELAAALAALGAPDSPGLLDVLGALRPELVAPRAPQPPPVAREVPDAPTLAFVAGNLPPARDSFHGRAGELVDLARRVRERERPLLSLLGPGGTGKTRLALAVARELAPELPGGSWFFDLSEARDADAACAVVAAALGVDLDRQDPVRQLGRALAYRGRALVVVDNLEQLVPALPDTLGRWLELAPEVTFVATSRVALHLRGERRIGVEPLDVDAGVELFLDRAARPPSAAERPEVARLVEALEGLPLAIELAAARTRVLPVSRIRERLGQRLQLLVDGDRDRPARQRSLLASLEGSWELLSPLGRATLTQLTVFDGGATLPAAEGVVDLGADAPWILDALDELVDASLVRVDADGERFRMLATVQEWARTHLAPEVAPAAEGRHGAWFSALGHPDALRLLDRPGSVERLVELCDEVDNLVGACRRAVARRDAATAVGALLAAAEVFVTRGPLSAARALSAEVAGLALDDAQAAAVEAVRAQTELLAGRLTEAGPHLDEGIRRARVAGDLRRAWSLESRRAWRTANLGLGDGEGPIGAVLAAAEGLRDPRLTAQLWRDAGGVAWAAGRHEEALRRMVRAREGFAAVGDARGESGTLMNLGVVCSSLGRHDEARRWLVAGDQVLRRYGDRRHQGLVQVNLGTVEVGVGRPDRALPHLVAADELLGLVGDERNRATALANGALCLRELGRWREAGPWLDEARGLQQRIGDARAEAITCWHLATLAQERGRFDEALALLDEALRLASATDLRRAVPQLHAKVGYVTFDAGRREEGLRRAEEGVAQARATDDWAAVAQTLGSVGAMALRAGDPARALRALEEAVARMPGGPDALLPLLSLLGEARARTGDPRGLPDLDLAIRRFREGGFHPSLAEALLQRALVAGDGAALAEATALVDALELPPAAPLRRLRDEVEAAHLAHRSPET
jgi:predicted ATPase